MGLFDTVLFDCPSCKETIEKQSRMGECHLLYIDSREVPRKVAEGLLEEAIHCVKCRKKFSVQEKVIKTVHLFLVES